MRWLLLLGISVGVAGCVASGQLSESPFYRDTQQPTSRPARDNLKEAEAPAEPKLVEIRGWSGYWFASGAGDRTPQGRTFSGAPSADWVKLDSDEGRRILKQLGMMYGDARLVAISEMHGMAMEDAMDRWGWEKGKDAGKVLHHWEEAKAIVDRQK